jgi:hypothetical protein
VADENDDFIPSDIPHDVVIQEALAPYFGGFDEAEEASKAAYKALCITYRRVIVDAEELGRQYEELQRLHDSYDIVRGQLTAMRKEYSIRTGEMVEEMERAETAEKALREALQASRGWQVTYNEEVSERMRVAKQRDEAEAAIARGREIHACDDSNPHGLWCGTCTTAWPCRTWTALDDSQAATVPPEADLPEEANDA